MVDKQLLEQFVQWWHKTRPIEEDSPYEFGTPQYWAWTAFEAAAKKYGYTPRKKECIHLWDIHTDVCRMCGEKRSYE